MIQNLTPFFLLIVGFYGLVAEHVSLIRNVYSVEILVLGCSYITILASILDGESYGLIMVLGLLSLVAVESAVGLALIITVFRVSTTPSFSDLTELHG